MKRILESEETKAIRRSCIFKNEKGEILQTALYNKNGDLVIVMKSDGSYYMIEYDYNNKSSRLAAYDADSKLINICDASHSTVKSLNHSILHAVFGFGGIATQIIRYWD